MIPTISVSALKKMIVPLPPIEKQEKIATSYQAKQNEIKELQEKIEKAQEESEIEHSSIKGKLLFWTAHSLLHLLGYDHEKSKRDDVFMRERAEQVMSSIGYPHWNCRA